MIHKEECDVVAGEDGSWSLSDPEGDVEAYLPAGFAANQAAAEPILMMKADDYNRGYARGMAASRRQLQDELHTLMNIASRDQFGEGA